MLIDEVCSIVETASAGATSTSSIASCVANDKKKKKKYYNSDGTIKNAVDIPDNVFSGKNLKRNMGNENKQK